MTDGIGASYAPPLGYVPWPGNAALGERLNTCPFFCAGHIDPAHYHEHASDPVSFGPDVSVAATRIDGAQAMVSLMDLPYDPDTHTVSFDPALARQIARQMLAEADAADCDRIMSGLRATAA